jgi:hypothetical protein
MSAKRQTRTLIKYFFRSILSDSKVGAPVARLVSRPAYQGGLVGRPYIRLTPDKAIIQLYYCSGQLSDEQINTLGNTLSLCWNRPIELTVIRINYFLLDRSILAQYISINSGKYSFKRIVDFLSSRLSSSKGKNETRTGIKIGLAGRLTTQRAGPRQTTQGVRLGSSSSVSSGNNMDAGSFTSKNKLGAFTVKV